MTGDGVEVRRQRRADGVRPTSPRRCLTWTSNARPSTADHAATFVTVAGQNINELDGEDRPTPTSRSTSTRPRNSRSGSLAAPGRCCCIPIIRKSISSGSRCRRRAAVAARRRDRRRRSTTRTTASRSRAARSSTAISRLTADGTFGRPGDALKVTLKNVDVAASTRCCCASRSSPAASNASATVTGTKDEPHVERRPSRSTRADSGSSSTTRFGGTVDYAAAASTLDARLQQNPTHVADREGLRAGGAVQPATRARAHDASTDRSARRQQPDRSRPRAGLHHGASTMSPGRSRRNVDVTGAGRRPAPDRQRHRPERRVHGRADRRRLHRISPAGSICSRTACTSTRSACSTTIRRRWRSPAISRIHERRGRRVVDLRQGRRLQGHRQQDGQRAREQRPADCRPAARAAHRRRSRRFDRSSQSRSDSRADRRRRRTRPRRPSSRPGRSTSAGQAAAPSSSFDAAVCRRPRHGAERPRHQGSRPQVARRANRSRRAERHARRRSRRPQGAVAISSRISAIVNDVRGNYDFQGRRFDILRDGTRPVRGPRRARIPRSTCARSASSRRSRHDVNVRGTLQAARDRAHQHAAARGSRHPVAHRLQPADQPARRRRSRYRWRSARRALRPAQSPVSSRSRLATSSSSIRSR